MKPAAKTYNVSSLLARARNKKGEDKVIHVVSQGETVAQIGSSTVESLANAHKPQRCGVFLSNFIYFYVACVACLWYNGFEVMTLETIF